MEKRRKQKQIIYPKYGAVIVARPGDETLLAGGTMMLHSGTNWTVLALCGKSQTELAEKFGKAVEQLGASGQMGDFESGAEKAPSDYSVQKTMLSLLFSERFDVIITHSLWGESEQDVMTELVAKRVLALTGTSRLIVKQVWQFAYELGREGPALVPVKEADIQIEVPEQMWQKKHDIITKTYGYSPESPEAQNIVHKEAFWLLGQRKKSKKRETKKE